MMKDEQEKTPLFTALKKHIKDQVIPFHVPGHKHGYGLKEFRRFVGDNVLLMDVNSMIDLDNLSNPVSVIKEAEELAAKAFKADNAQFLINGTSSGIHAMMMGTLSPGDKIVLPRNAHKSAFTGLIISGAIPVYTETSINEAISFSSNVSPESAEKALIKAENAKALFVLNPTYFGLATDLKKIVKIAHKHKAIVLADEAHGCLFTFHEDLPPSAMECGADISAVSTHKTGGSLTQSSLLLYNEKRIHTEDIFYTLNLLRSTSASYLLMSSIDVARKQLVLNGRKMIQNAIELADYARNEINKIDGFVAFGDEILKNDSGAKYFDRTKLVISVKDSGFSGFKIDRILREEFKIQIELADFNNILAIIAVGDTLSHIKKLVAALKEISKLKCLKCKTKLISHPELPELVMTPREVFYSYKKIVPLKHSAGLIAGEMVMAYPPGIPIICPGERITKEIISYINLLKMEEGCVLEGTADPSTNMIRVI